jgi:hypothetical protein
MKFKGLDDDDNFLNTGAEDSGLTPADERKEEQLTPADEPESKPLIKEKRERIFPEKKVSVKIEQPDEEKIEKVEKEEV